MCQDDWEFVLYDTSPGAKKRAPQVLWEHDEEITDWDMCLATSEEGHWVVYVLSVMKDSSRWYVCHFTSICGHFFYSHRPCRTLLEFRLDAESGALCDTVILDVPVSHVHGLVLFGGQKPLVCSPFLAIPSQSLVFDTRTRAFYEFPNFRIALVCCDQ